jgi:glycogen synthase
MTAIEAMACGTPTVITTEGGLWDMVSWGTDALYANPLDVEAFGHAIATVLLYPRIATQLAHHGSQRARASFTWNGIAQRIVNLPQLLAVNKDREAREDPPDGRSGTGGEGDAGARDREPAGRPAGGNGVRWVSAASS